MSSKNELNHYKFLKDMLITIQMRGQRFNHDVYN